MLKFPTLVMALLCFMLSVVPAFARTLTVDGVMSPAWAERAGKREPLTVGMQLNDNDRIITGERARVMLRMSEGSAIKLGENTTLALGTLTETLKPDKTPLVSASLDVVKGAFRFTTGVFGNPRAERDANVKFGVITAGVRGTDLWGRSVDVDDLVCLLEGKISVRHAKQEFVLNEAAQILVVPRNEKAKPVSKMSQKQIAEWSLETEITEGLGAVRTGGAFRVELMRTLDVNAARALEARLKDAGYPAVIDPLKEGYAVCVLGIATAKDRDALQVRWKSLLAGAPRST